MGDILTIRGYYRDYMVMSLLVDCARQGDFSLLVHAMSLGKIQKCQLDCCRLSGRQFFKLLGAVFGDLTTKHGMAELLGAVTCMGFWQQDMSQASRQ